MAVDTVMYCEPDEVLRQLDKQKETGPAGEASLETIIHGISGAIDGFYNQPPGFFSGDQTGVARTFNGTGSQYIITDWYHTLESVSIGSTTVLVADLKPFRGSIRFPNWNRSPYWGIYYPNGYFDEQFIDVTAMWGYSATIPETIRQACVALCVRTLKQAEGGWADTLASIEFGQMLFQRENSDIKFLLDNARQFRRAVI